MKPSEIRAKGLKERLKILDEKREELFGLRLKLRTGQLAQTTSTRNVKRDIARLMTLMATPIAQEKKSPPKRLKKEDKDGKQQS